MPEERTCDYTGTSIEPGTGIMYVKADGEILHFVDSKAEKNYFLGREPRDLQWTEAGRAEAAGRRAAQVEVETTAEDTAESADAVEEAAAAVVDETEEPPAVDEPAESEDGQAADEDEDEAESAEPAESEETAADHEPAEEPPESDEAAEEPEADEAEVRGDEAEQ